MRNGLVIISIMAIMGLALGMALPVVHAQEPGDTTVSFHVHPNGTGNGSQSLSVIPPDAQDRILIAGNSTTTITPRGSGKSMWNRCG